MTQEKQNLSAVALKYIRNSIYNQKLRPGSRISESTVAKHLGISRSPVRESLRILEQEGLVQYETNKGFKVTFLSPEEAFEVFYLRGSLEVAALRASGGRISYLHLTTMKRALDEMENAQRNNDILNIVESDKLFHSAIVRNAGMNRLFEVWDSLSPLNLSMFLTGQNAMVFSLKDQYEKHKEVYDILKSGNLDESCQMIMDHYAVTGEKIFNNLYIG